MKITLLDTLLISAGLLALSLPPAWADDNGVFSLTAGFDYSSGKYGSNVITEITSVPLMAKYEADRWVFKLSIPYVTITGPGNVTPGIGQTQSTANTERTTVSGLGDIVAGTSYNLYGGNDTMPVIDLTGKVKFGTADASKGMGTGKNDYIAQTDLYKSFGHFTALGTVGYRVYGDSSAAPLDSVFFGSVGGTYKLATTTSAGVIYDYRPAITRTGSAVSEAMAFVSHKIANNWKGQGYLVKGFSNGSPDYGVGALIGYVF